ncbi:hypothetical protein BGZ61DRAFT_478634 [Ilyonectria robusta]|uniref:uncharacterized protein n=1 Tax=Ilyonectria robusta TaxID=1079257 RepID=UPI001E8E2C69|nr:uncharacterized protein BGZ61DRAFT_478634 [Ilyonectria robusta]KAH8688307.1 hypothetical protein BGZ61DRAFT_478634 [Ilyonectria robusta]
MNSRTSRTRRQSETTDNETAGRMNHLGLQPRTSLHHKSSEQLVLPIDPFCHLPTIVTYCFKPVPVRSPAKADVASFSTTRSSDGVLLDNIRRIEKVGIRPMNATAQHIHLPKCFFHQFPRRTEVKATIIALICRTNSIYCRNCIKSYKNTVNRRLQPSSRSMGPTCSPSPSRAFGFAETQARGQHS